MVDLKQTMVKSRFHFRRRSIVPSAAKTRRNMRRHEIVLPLPKARNRRLFFRVLELLHELLPLRHTVVVHTNKRLSFANGLCSLRDGRRYRRKGRLIPDGPFFYIAICSSLSDASAARCIVPTRWHGQSNTIEKSLGQAAQGLMHNGPATALSGASPTVGPIVYMSSTSCPGSGEKTPGESERESDRREHVAPRQRILRSDRHSDKFRSTKRAHRLPASEPLHVLPAQASHVGSMTAGGLASYPKSLMPR